MGASISANKEKKKSKREEMEELQMQIPSDVDIEEGLEFTGSWIYSALGAAIAIPIGIKRKTLGPLVFYGGTGAMVDILMSVKDHEEKKHQRLLDYVEKQKAAVAAAVENAYGIDGENFSSDSKDEYLVDRTNV